MNSGWGEQCWAAALAPYTPPAILSGPGPAFAPLLPPAETRAAAEGSARQVGVGGERYPGTLGHCRGIFAGRRARDGGRPGKRRLGNGRQAEGEAERGREELRSSEFWTICHETVRRAVNKYHTTPKAPASSHSPDVGAAKVLEDQKDDIDLCQTTLDLVCYGIGNFSDSVASRYQLALLFLLLETLQIPRVSCLLFDPLFTEWEKSFLKDCGMVVITANEEGKRPINRPTLFYMVHCGKALYNNLLWRNWSPQQLAQTILIGNSFKGIEERSPARILQRDYTYISYILAVTEEAAFPDSNRYRDVFNDTSIHQFPRAKLDAKPREFWESAAEPMYQQCEDLEIIQNG